MKATVRVPARGPRVGLAFDLDAAFRTVLGAYHARAMLGSEALDLVFFRTESEAVIPDSWGRIVGVLLAGHP